MAATEIEANKTKTQLRKDKRARQAIERAAAAGMAEANKGKAVKTETKTIIVKKTNADGKEVEEEQ